MKPMRRIIRSKETGKFFKDGKWIEDFHDATNFVSTVDAARACSRYNLKNTELVLSFGNRKMDMTIPICE